MQLVGGHRAHAPQPAHRQRMQEGQLLIGRNKQQPIGFGFLTGHFREEFRAGDPDGDGQADVVADVGAQPCCDLDRCAGDPAQPADVEKRLVDRERLHDRGAIAEHLEHVITGPRIGAHPGRHHHGVRTEAPCLRTAHRGAHTVGLGLVAGRQYHPAADDHRAPAQARVVTLLDGRIERIQVRMEDGAAHRTNICSHGRPTSPRA